jgi:uncharacterized OB-fold protein
MEKIRAPWTATFWEGVEAQKLMYQRCLDCSIAFFPPQKLCAFCSSPQLGWEQSKGEGSVYSFSIVYKHSPEEFTAELPYVVAIISLDEGYRMSSRLIGKDPASWSCDDRVTLQFADIPTGTRFPFFSPAAN